MDAKILQEESRANRIEILKNTAEKLEELTYPRSLDQEEVTRLKDEYTKESIKLAKEDEAKKDFMTDYKAKTKPIKLELGTLMVKIRNKVEEVTEDVYLISDQEKGMMGYYNYDGVLVSSRALRQEERQFSIMDHTIKKAQ